MLRLNKESSFNSRGCGVNLQACTPSKIKRASLLAAALFSLYLLGDNNNKKIYMNNLLPRDYSILTEEIKGNLFHIMIL